jgi:hypothetical protein
MPLCVKLDNTQQHSLHFAVIVTMKTRARSYLPKDLDELHAAMDAEDAELVARARFNRKHGSGSKGDDDDDNNTDYGNDGDLDDDDNGNDNDDANDNMDDDGGVSMMDAGDEMLLARAKSDDDGMGRKKVACGSDDEQGDSQAKVGLESRNPCLL